MPSSAQPKTEPWAEFRRGLTTPSARGLVASFLLAAGLLLALEVALERGLLWRLPVQWLLSTPLDDWSHASWLVGRMQGDQGDTELVVILGGSAAREAVHGNEKMSELLSARAERPVQFLNLGTRNQTVAEALVLVEQLPPVRRGVAIFSVHPMFLRDGPEDWREALTGVRFPYSSPALQSALARVAPEVAPPPDFNVVRFRPQVANWLTRRLARRAPFAPIEYVEHLYTGRGPQSDAALAHTLKVVQDFLAGYPTYRDDNLALLAEAVAIASSKGYRVLLLDLPRNPVGDRTVLAPFLADYTQALSQLAGRTGVPYLDMHARLAFERRDFYDHAHFVDAARTRFVPEFVDTLIRLGVGGAA